MRVWTCQACGETHEKCTSGLTERIAQLEAELKEAREESREIYRHKTRHEVNEFDLQRKLQVAREALTCAVKMLPRNDDCEWNCPNQKFHDLAEKALLEIG